jgi:CDP-2,3-bis-(O-geranylgeranyl)-sn-glycerol synthase
MSYLESALLGFWLFIPAYIANPSAVLFGGMGPMDFRRVGSDGNRLLGDGKTWSGLFGGTMAAMFIGVIQLAIGAVAGSDDYFGFGETPNAYWILFLLAFGSLWGDILGSFIKRRLGKERGAKTYGLDQYDFIIGAFLFVAIFQWNWLYASFIEGESIIGLLTILAITPLLHKGMNVLGYKMGKKDVPW